MTTTWRTDVTELVAALLDEQDGSIDTYGIAQEAVGRIYDEAVLRSLAVKGAQEIVGEVMRSRRQPVRSGHDNRSHRWEQVRDAQARLRAYTVPRTDGPNTPLLDCSADDLADVAKYYRDREQSFRKRAEAFERLERRVRELKADSVADLDADEVGGILNV